MRKITTITGFIQDIAFLVDKGISFSIDEINRHIENRDLVDWLERKFPFGSDYGLDFSMFKTSHRNYLHDEYEAIWGGYVGQERRKWGITENGLCLLICWGIEIIRNLYRSDKINFDDEWIKE